MVHPQDVGVVGRRVQRMHNDGNQKSYPEDNEMDSEDCALTRVELRMFAKFELKTSSDLQVLGDFDRCDAGHSRISRLYCFEGGGGGYRSVIPSQAHGACCHLLRSDERSRGRR